MKDTEVKRWLYQDSEGFKEGIEVGKMETIDKARQWFEDRFYNGGMHLLENPDGGYREAQKLCDTMASKIEDETKRVEQLWEVMNDSINLESEVDELIKEIEV